MTGSSQAPAVKFLLSLKFGLTGLGVLAAVNGACTLLPEQAASDPAPPETSDATASGTGETSPTEGTAPSAVEPLRCLAPETPMAALHSADDPDGFPSAACVDQARALVAQMSLSEKVGQMMQPDRGALVGDGDISQFAFGSLLSGGGSAPLGDNTPLAWATMINEYRSRSLESRLGIPMIYGIDAVHGHNNVREAVIFPHNIGLGASRDPELVERVGRVTAEEVAGTNIDWTFSPVLAAARDERWGRTYEAFGETPELAELLGPALIRGLQGPRLGRGPNSVLACAKHFLGDGNTFGGDDQGNALLTLDEVRENLLPAYRRAIETGVGSIMVSYSSIDGVKMHCHGPLLNDILKGELGFSGLLVSDWQAIEQLPGDYATKLTSSINAGVDLVMNPRTYVGFIDTLESLVPERISTERIDDATTRILTVKCELGMLAPDAYPRAADGSLPINSEVANVGSAAHREVAREAVRRSLVLLKNDAGILPIDKGIARVHLAGSHADNLGAQCGGWTISWQGQYGTPTLGTTVRQAFEAALGPEHVTISRDGTGAEGADVGVLVVGERPYAEGRGDDLDLELDPSAVAAARAIKAAGVPLVVVLMSGRPMILGELLPLADAFVAAWLPGTEGSGLSDVLLGDFDFTGTLPHSWPRSIDQVPINVGDATYDPLFAYGFGLHYSSGGLDTFVAGH